MEMLIILFDDGCFFVIPYYRYFNFFDFFIRVAVLCIMRICCFLQEVCKI